MLDSVEVVEADAVDPRQLVKIQREYGEWKKARKEVPKDIRFNYSWSLIRTKDKRLISEG